MPLRFTRRLSLIPGLRVNLSKGGGSLSVGHRGAWYAVGPRRGRATLGLPGTGLDGESPSGSAAACGLRPRRAHARIFRAGPSPSLFQPLVPGLAPVVDAGRPRPGAVGERLEQIGQLGVAVLFHEPRHVVGPAPAARLADDR